MLDFDDLILCWNAVMHDADKRRRLKPCAGAEMCRIGFASDQTHAMTTHRGTGDFIG